MEDFLTALRNPYTVVLVVITTEGTLIAIIFRDAFGWMGQKDMVWLRAFITLGFARLEAYLYLEYRWNQGVA